MKSGFGATKAKHSSVFRQRLTALEGHLKQARQLANNGMCDALVDSAEQAFRVAGEAQAHRDEMPPREREFTATRWVEAGRGLNFLRQWLKRCSRG